MASFVSVWCIWTLWALVHTPFQTLAFVFTTMYLPHIWVRAVEYFQCGLQLGYLPPSKRGALCIGGTRFVPHTPSPFWTGPLEILLNKNRYYAAQRCLGGRCQEILEVTGNALEVAGV